MHMQMHGIARAVYATGKGAPCSNQTYSAGIICFLKDV